MSSADYGYPYYNKPKPLSYIRQMYEYRLKSVEAEIKKLELEKVKIEEELSLIKK